jgi:hypothetical protein
MPGISPKNFQDGKQGFQLADGVFIGAAPNRVRLSVGTSAATRTYNFPNVGASVTFATREANEIFSGNKIFSGEISTDAAHLGGYGLVPVGTIVAYNPGFYTGGTNGGYTNTGPAGNTIAQINTFLNAKGWYVCNGAAVNVAASPIWNAASRFLPNLSDSRFLIGATDTNTGNTTYAGTGSNTVTLAAGNIPSLTSAGTVTNTGTTVASTSGIQSADHSHNFSGTTSSGSTINNLRVETNVGGGTGTWDGHVPSRTNTLSGAPNGTTFPGREHTHTYSGTTSGMSVNHTHSIPSLTVNSGQTVSATYTNASPTAISKLPQYLGTFYIIRVF